jgi:hypothetical protein
LYCVYQAIDNQEINENNNASVLLMFFKDEKDKRRQHEQKRFPHVTRHRAVEKERVFIYVQRKAY